MADVEKQDAMQSVHVSDVLGTKDDGNAVNEKSITQAAADRAEFDHALTIKDAIKYYRWAIFWCLTIR